jgi:O-antigen/teichoic acid export membrane protein/SAM-dependent methyltransferase
LAHILGPTGLGALAIATSVATAISIFVEYGFDISALRDVSSAKPGDQGRVLINVTAVKLALFGLAGLIFGVLTLSVPASRFPADLNLVVLLGGARGFNLGWYFLGTGRATVSALFDVVAQLIWFVPVFFLVHSASDVNLILTCQLAAAVVLVVLTYATALMKMDLSQISVDRRLVIEQVKSGAPMFVFKVAGAAYFAIIALILGAVAGRAQVGYLNAADRFVGVIVTAFGPAAQALLPYVYGRVAKGGPDATFGVARSISVGLLGVGIVFTVGACVSAKLLIAVFVGSQFTPSIQVLQILSLMFPFVAINYALGVYVMLPLRLDVSFVAAVLAAQCLGLGLTYLVAPGFGAAGVAFIRVGTEATMSIIFSLILYNKGYLKKLLFQSQYGWIKRFLTYFNHHARRVRRRQRQNPAPTSRTFEHPCADGKINPEKRSFSSPYLWIDQERARPNTQEYPATNQPRDPVASCPCCSEAVTRTIYRALSIPVHSCVLLDSVEAACTFPRRDLELAYCGACGFVFNRAFDEAVMTYSPKFEESQHFSGTFNSFAKGLACEIARRCTLTGKHVLEIGCGKGEFLRELCRVGGATGLGIDPGYRADEGRDNGSSNVQFIVDFFEPHKHLSADVILCRHTLEHISSVAHFVRSIRDMAGVRDDSWIIFETPDAKRVLGEGAFWDIYYEHCSYFSPGAHARLFRNAGFEVTDLALAYNEQYIVQYARPAPTRTKPRLPLEQDLAEMHALAAAFPDRVRNVQNEWRERLRSAWAEGRRVVLWGGSSKAVSFLTTLGLKDEVSAVVDINPYKQGKYMPGTGHRVIAPRALVGERPDLVVVMNPIYVDEITSGLRALGLEPDISTVGPM